MKVATIVERRHKAFLYLHRILILKEAHFYIVDSRAKKMHVFFLFTSDCLYDCQKHTACSCIGKCIFLKYLSLVFFKEELNDKLKDCFQVTEARSSVFG